LLAGRGLRFPTLNLIVIKEAVLGFVLSEIPKCEGPPPDRRRPVRGGPDLGHSAFAAAHSAPAAVEWFYCDCQYCSARA